MISYYVSIMGGIGRVTHLLGPIDEHQKALDMIEPVKQIASNLDQSIAMFNSFGVFKIDYEDKDLLKPGLLNHLFMEQL